MCISDIFGTRVILGGSDQVPAHHNDNLELMTGCRLTPAELLQWVRREKVRLRNEVVINPALWSCPKHRQDWIVTLGLEQLTLWKCYGVWGA